MEGYPRHSATDQGHTNTSFQYAADDGDHISPKDTPPHDNPENKPSAKPTRVTHGGKPTDKAGNDSQNKKSLGGIRDPEVVSTDSPDDNDEQKPSQRKKMNQQPIAYCALVVRHPKKAFGKIHALFVSPPVLSNLSYVRSIVLCMKMSLLVLE